MVKITAKNCQNVQRVLFLAATEMELRVVRELYGTHFATALTGIGTLNTTLNTLRAIEEHSPELVVQIGIAGAVKRELSIGDVVEVTSDYEADLGAYRVEEGKFIKFNSISYSYEAITELRPASGRTVTTACTPLVEDSSDIETMEGVALFAAAKSRGVRPLQIRAISNYITDSREQWDIPLALEALRERISEIFTIQHIE